MDATKAGVPNPGVLMTEDGKRLMFQEEVPAPGVLMAEVPPPGADYFINRRRKNFCPKELNIIISSVEDNTDLIYNKVNCNAVHSSKHDFWLGVTTLINETCHLATKRDVKEVRRKWVTLQSEVKSKAKEGVHLLNHNEARVYQLIQANQTSDGLSMLSNTFRIAPENTDVRSGVSVDLNQSSSSSISNVNISNLSNLPNLSPGLQVAPLSSQSPGTAGCSVPVRVPSPLHNPATSTLLHNPAVTTSSPLNNLKTEVEEAELLVSICSQVIGELSATNPTPLVPQAVSQVKPTFQTAQIKQVPIPVQIQQIVPPTTQIHEIARQIAPVSQKSSTPQTSSISQLASQLAATQQITATSQVTPTRNISLPSSLRSVSTSTPLNTSTSSSPAGPVRNIVSVLPQSQTLNHASKRARLGDEPPTRQVLANLLTSPRQPQPPSLTNPVQEQIVQHLAELVSLQHAANQIQQQRLEVETQRRDLEREKFEVEKARYEIEKERLCQEIISRKK